MEADFWMTAPLQRSTLTSGLQQFYLANANMVPWIRIVVACRIASELGSSPSTSQYPQTLLSSAKVITNALNMVNCAAKFLGHLWQERLFRQSILGIFASALCRTSLRTSRHLLHGLLVYVDPAPDASMVLSLKMAKRLLLTLLCQVAATTRRRFLLAELS